MKKIFVLLACVTIGFLNVQAQDVVYDENVEARTITDFSAIEVSGSISLYLSQGNEYGIAISAGEQKNNSRIKTEVKNGVLKISVDGGLWNGMGWANRKLKAYVSFKTLNELTVSGASFVTSNGPITADALKIEVSGASEIKASINVKQLDLDISGASVAKLSGSADNASIDASGATKVSSYEMSINSCNAAASGASSIRITANKELNASASGGANIYYKGAASVVNINSSRGADVKKQD